nr:hypothetical protein Iba_chr02dCG4940 [Ipomoea batatas]GME10708.1 hypothetical protein Iba_scaffold10455CG0010 [Ipomoea batatas]
MWTYRINRCFMTLKCILFSTGYCIPHLQKSVLPTSNDRELFVGIGESNIIDTSSKKLTSRWFLRSSPPW